MKNYYFDIILDDFVADKPSRIFSSLHSSISKINDDRKIGVDFPKLRTGDRKTVGSVIRVFSPCIDHIKFLSQTAGIKIKGAFITAIRFGNLTQCTARNRKGQPVTDVYIAGMLRQKERRCKKTGEDFSLFDQAAYKRYLHSRHKSGLPYVSLKSDSTKQHYTIHIERVPLDENFQSNSYGLLVGDQT